ncbi:MAG: hypothetical protein ABI884_10490 [Gemmatimonadota bacterium]
MAAKKVKKRAKKSAAKVKKRAKKSAMLAPSFDDDDVESGVTAVVAQVCGVKPSEVGGKPLSKLTSSCDMVFRGRLASQLNAKWRTLNPRFSSDDLACSDTVDSLTREVTDRLG